MQFLALLTLNILLLTSFIQNINYSRGLAVKENNIIEKQSAETISFSANNNQSILGSYVVSYDAVARNAQSETKSAIQEDEAESTEVQGKYIESVNLDTEKVIEDKEEQTEVIEVPDNATILMNKINSYRKENGLTSFSYNPTVCSFAALRAQELSTEFSHNGFRKRIDSNTLPYSDYSSIGENIADTDSPNSAF